MRSLVHVYCIKIQIFVFYLVFLEDFIQAEAYELGSRKTMFELLEKTSM
jgi:hypothetical protein